MSDMIMFDSISFMALVSLAVSFFVLGFALGRDRK